MTVTAGLEPFHGLEINALARKLEAEGRDIAFLEQGQPAAPPAPKVIEAVRAVLDGPQMYTHFAGTPALRAALAQYYEAQHGVTVDPGSIVATMGSSAGFILAFLGAFAPGAKIAVTRPGYTAYLNTLYGMGFRPVEIPVSARNGWHLHAADIEAAYAAEPFDGLLLASPANPTGAAVSREQLAAIVATCRTLGVRFISDEIYHGLDYRAASISALELTADAIVINSFSKYYCMTGWRIGWMVLPGDILRRTQILQQNLFIAAPTLSQIAATAALGERDYSEAQKAHYAANRPLLTAGLRALGFGVDEGDGAFYCYADASRFTNDSLSFCKQMLEVANVATSPGVDFDRVNGNRYVRFSYAGSRETIDKALDRMSRFPCALAGAPGAGVLVALAAMVVATQLFAFRTEVIDWDESTFMLMAQDVLRGHLPYAGIFDNKPPLVFFVLAAAMAVFGQSLEVVRWAGDACIFASAAMIFAICRPRGTPMAALVALGFIAAHVTSYGLHTSSEIVANVFVTGALWAMMAKPSGWKSWAVGALLALAVLTRGNLALVVIAVGLAHLVAVVRPGFLGLRRDGIVGYVVGGLVPPLLLAGLYTSAGAFGDLWLATVTVPLSYAATQESVLAVGTSFVSQIWAGDEALAVACLSLAFAVALLLTAVTRPRALVGDIGLPLLVFVATLLSIVVGGVYYTHYLLQLLPSAAVIIGLAAAGRGRIIVSGITAAAAILALWYALPRSADMLLHYGEIERDLPLRQAAAVIEVARQPGDEVWPLTNQLVLFYLDQPPLSRAGTQPDNLVRRPIIGPLEAAGYVPPEEFARLVKLAPRYVVTDADGSVFYATGQNGVDFRRMLSTRYKPFLQTPAAMIFRRTDS